MWFFWLYIIDSNQYLMGCCTSVEPESVRSSFEQAWDIFKKAELSKPEHILKEKSLIFRFLFLSIAIPLYEYTKDKISNFRQKLPRNDPKLPTVEKEIMEIGRIAEILKAQSNNLYTRLIKVKSGILSDDQRSVPSFKEVEKGTKQRESKRNENYIYDRDSFGNQASAAERDRKEKEKSFNILRDSQSVRQIQENNLVQSFNTYSIPLTAYDTQRSFPNPNPTDSSAYPYNFKPQDRQEELQFQRDRRIDLQQSVLKLDAQIEEITKQLKQKEKKQAYLQKNLDNEKKVRKQVEASMGRLMLELEQYRSELNKLDRQRIDALRENFYLKGRMKDLSITFNTSAINQQQFSQDNRTQRTFSMQDLLSQRTAHFTVVHSMEEHVQPTVLHIKSFSSLNNTNKQLQRSFLFVEDDQSSESQKDNGYAVLFNLFSTSKVLPSLSDFQAAVGMRTIIADMLERRPIRTQLLFTFDPITPNHYGKYIEGRQNILLLIKLPHNITIGAFSGNLAEDKTVTDSLLFSMGPQREPMRLTPVRSILKIDMDPSQLVFGNSQLKIKAKTLELTCNVGSFQSTYIWCKRTVPFQKFVGSSQRNLIMQDYEIHQLYFQDT